MPCPSALIAALALAVILSGRLVAGNYCSVCGDHTLCITRPVGPACRGYRAVPLSDNDRAEFVHIHNLYRNWVASGNEGRGNGQPSAANMNRLFFNYELEYIAQRWASQCRFQHDTCRKLSNGTSVGQNIYYESSTSALGPPDWWKVISSWYGEVDKTNGRDNVHPYRFNGAVGHYTQLTWASTRIVGCGIAQYTDTKNGRKYNARLYVCDYGPSGNVVGAQMYEGGPPASRCPTARDSYYNSLCE